jgi:hypothetical protein
MILHSPLWAEGLAFLMILGAGLAMAWYSRSRALSYWSQFWVWIVILMATAVFLTLVS